MVPTLVQHRIVLFEFTACRQEGISANKEPLSYKKAFSHERWHERYVFFAMLSVQALAPRR